MWPVLIRPPRWRNILEGWRKLTLLILKSNCFNSEVYFRKEQLYNIAESLNLLPPLDDDGGSSALEKYSEQFLLELLVTRYERRQSQLDYINELPLYPTEDIIWDENLVPNEYFSGEGMKI